MYWWIRLYGAHACNVLTNCAQVISYHLRDIRGEFLSYRHESLHVACDLILQAQVYVNNKASRA